MAAVSTPVNPPPPLDEATYRRRIRAWTLYDWANSAYVTTVLAAVLPAYYSRVAGASLPSAAVATGYWSLTLSISLLIAAVISPILGTVSDVMRGKKRFLTAFMLMGVLGAGLLVLVDTGDWLLASLILVFGRIGLVGSLVFYDALLPHVAKPEDQDSVSARGYATGYLGGGLLLAVNIAMIFFLPGTWGARLSFLSVAIWWLVFSIPLLRQVPEPPAATLPIKPGQTVVGLSFQRLRETFGDLSRYKQLVIFLVAFLIYNDAIGTIISLAVIYGAELGFGDVELILALLLVQFVGIPFSLIFGRLPSPQEKRRAYYLAFIVFNTVALPVLGILFSRVLPGDLSGARAPSYASTATAVGTGLYPADHTTLKRSGEWTTRVVPASESGAERDVTYASSAALDARFELTFNGQQVEITYSTGPDYGMFAVELDGKPYLDAKSKPVQVDGYHASVRYGETLTIRAEKSGEHTLALAQAGPVNPQSTGTKLAIGAVRVAEPARQNSLPLIIGLLLAVQAVGGGFAYVAGRYFTGLVNSLNTKRSIVLSLIIYSLIAIWGFFVDSTVEFWFLAWMVAIVQGGSQALSRSLFSAMSPALKSGEFFGLFGVMEKFSSILGPLLFALAVVLFGSSRPAILSLIAFFIIGGLLLLRVNVEEGIRVAREDDAAYASGG